MNNDLYNVYFTYLIMYNKFYQVCVKETRSLPIFTLR